MPLSAAQAVTFGCFPGVLWTRAHHFKFPRETRDRVETILLMCHRERHPVSREPTILTHPECPLAKLPVEFIEDLVQYVAGSSSAAIHSLFDSPNSFLSIQPGTPELEFHMSKPRDIDGIIVEMDIKVDVRAISAWADGVEGLFQLNMNGVKFELLVHKVGLSNNTSAYCPFILKIQPGAVEGAGNNGPIHPTAELTPVFKFKLRLALQPYGPSHFMMKSPTYDMTLPWNATVEDHGICPGVVQDYQGSTRALPCLNTHELFHTKSLNFRFAIKPDIAPVVVSNVKVVFM